MHLWTFKNEGRRTTPKPRTWSVTAVAVAVAASPVATAADAAAADGAVAPGMEAMTAKRPSPWRSPTSGWPEAVTIAEKHPGAAGGRRGVVKTVAGRGGEADKKQTARGARKSSKRGRRDRNTAGG